MDKPRRKHYHRVQGRSRRQREKTEKADGELRYGAKQEIRQCDQFDSHLHRQTERGSEAQVENHTGQNKTREIIMGKRILEQLIKRGVDMRIRTLLRYGRAGRRIATVTTDKPEQVQGQVSRGDETQHRRKIHTRPSPSGGRRYKITASTRCRRCREVHYRRIRLVRRNFVRKEHREHATPPNRLELSQVRKHGRDKDSQNAPNAEEKATKKDNPNSATKDWARTKHRRPTATQKSKIRRRRIRKKRKRLRARPERTIRTK